MHLIHTDDDCVSYCCVGVLLTGAGHLHVVAQCKLNAGTMLAEPLAHADNMTRLLLLGLPQTVDPDNPAETNELMLAASPDDPESDTKLLALQMASLGGPHHLRRFCAEEKHEEEAVELRVLAALGIICGELNNDKVRDSLQRDGTHFA